MRISDWSSDVCSSDLAGHWQPVGFRRRGPAACHAEIGLQAVDRADMHMRRTRRQAGGRGERGARKSVVHGKSVAVRVDLGGSRIITKKIIITRSHIYTEL